MLEHRFLMRRRERIIFVALVATVGLAIYYWDDVHNAHHRMHNTLGSVNTHVPTADLFLWVSSALIFYFGTRMWTVFAPHVFNLAPDRAAVWRVRLQWTRFVTTFLFLACTLFTIFGASLQSH